VTSTSSPSGIRAHFAASSAPRAAPNAQIRNRGCHGLPQRASLAGALLEADLVVARHHDFHGVRERPEPVGGPPQLVERAVGEQIARVDQDIAVGDVHTLVPEVCVGHGDDADHASCYRVPASTGALVTWGRDVPHEELLGLGVRRKVSERRQAS
jgi:hypothetical protein